MKKKIKEMKNIRNKENRIFVQKKFQIYALIRVKSGVSFLKKSPCVYLFIFFEKKIETQVSVLICILSLTQQNIIECIYVTLNFNMYLLLPKTTTSFIALKNKVISKRNEN